MQPKKEVEYRKRFSNELSEQLNFITNELSQEIAFKEITPDIFIMSCLEKTDTLLYRVCSSFLSVARINTIHDKIREALAEEFIVPIRPDREIFESGELRELLKRADDKREALGHPLITTDHILLAFLDKEGIDNSVKVMFLQNGATSAILERFSKTIHAAMSAVTSTEENAIEEPTHIVGLDLGNNDDTAIISIIPPKGAENDAIKRLTEFVQNAFGIEEPKQQPRPQQTKSQNSPIQYCRLVSPCGKDETIVGLDNELRQVIKVLSRKTKNNAIIVGESGVGKSSVVKKLATMISNGECPPSFKNKIVLTLDYTELIVGTQMRGTFEAKIQKLTNDLIRQKNIILFLENVHTILRGRMDDNYDFSGLLSTIFGSQNVMVIAETTPKEYHRNIESNTSFTNVFQKITISAPTEKETFEILRGKRNEFAAFHKVQYSDEVLHACVDSAKRYITERQLPSSAIDIMDEAGAIRKNNNPMINLLISKKVKEIEDTKALSALMAVSNSEDVKDKSKELEALKLEEADLEAQMKKQANEPVTLEDVCTAISEHTGIPVKRISATEKSILATLNDNVKKCVVGQDGAIDTVCRAIKRSKLGLSQPNRPILSAMFIGGTGTGKTLLAKTIAKEIFGSESSLIRLDMSEYSDKTSVNKLIGSSAGYVGYEEGGILTEAVKNKKHAVILIDEIEKSTDEVFNIFLQVLDEGFLSDNTGNKVDFRNTIILMTSNVGVKRSHDEREIGFAKNEATFRRDIIEKEVKHKFSPEFLNRIDEIVYFNPLTDENITNICKIELNKLNDRLISIGYSMAYDEKAISLISDNAKEQKEYGARPIARIIKAEIEDKIAELLIDNDLKEGHVFCVSSNEAQIVVK